MLPWILAAAIVGVGGPDGQVTVESGDLTATIGQANAWTIATIECDGVPVTIDAGAQSACVNPKNVGWTGGRSGEEQVASVTINGEACEVAPEGPLTGEVTIVKKSMLESIEHTMSLSFEDGLMRQMNEFSFTEDIDLSAFYPLIYSFTPEFTDWLAIPEEGEPFAGEFTSEEANHIGAEVPAFAMFNESTDMGVVVYLQRSSGSTVLLWDHPNYRKFFLKAGTGVYEAGGELEATMLLRCFEGGDDWQATAESIAEDLQEEYPVVKAASDTEAKPAAPELNYGEGVPEQGVMWVNTQNLAVKFEAPSAWTIDEIQWDDFTVSGPVGHYGTVLVPKGGDWIGTGHSEGGREVVHSLRFAVDGEERPVALGETLTGDEFELFKKSTIHKFDAEHTVTVKGSEIVETAHLTAAEAHELKLMYLFMHCIEPGTTSWIAELPDGTIEKGVLDSDKDAESTFELQKPARWVAQHFPDRDLSVLLYLTRVPTENGAMVQIWDLPRYHKFYVTQNRGLTLSEGDELDYTLVFTVVEDETGAWTATKAAAEALKTKYPPVDDEG